MVRATSQLEKLISTGWDETPEGCWEWRGFRNDKGYGKVGSRGGEQLAHRAAYREWVGEIPDGHSVMHVICDNRPCINPAHLKTGTHAENMEDMARKLRSPGIVLDATAVQQIRSRYDRGRESNTKIAVDFGVSRALISKIGRRISWKWLAENNKEEK